MEQGCEAERKGEGRREREGERYRKRKEDRGIERQETDRQTACEREKVVRRVWKARNEEESERERDENIRCGTK